MTNMKAARIHSYGDPEVLAYEDAPRPKPGKGEVPIDPGASCWSQPHRLENTFWADERSDRAQAAFDSWLGCRRCIRSGRFGCHQPPDWLTCV